MKMSQRSYLLVFLIISSTLNCKSISKNILKNFRLKDGSMIKGILTKNETLTDTLIIRNSHIGYIKLNKESLEYIGVNYNDGIMISYSPFFTKERNGAFGKGSIFSISSSKSSDENLTTSFELDYFYRNFEMNSSKFLRLEKEVNDDFLNNKIVKYTINNALYSYSSHFIMPSINIKLSIIPSILQEKLKQYHFFPYMGAGIGYNIAILKYKRISNDPIIIDNEIFYNKHIENKIHFYGGMLYKALMGFSIKLSTRCVLNTEFKYCIAHFTQFLTEDEKDENVDKETFKMNGFYPSFGVRFGFY
ncbi:MAG: hypothetical protein JW870_10825 [Candidatus Delongbacteria bacterium]|nr:hypothetical protein [Candidatus Delongbacteria bacterium]